MSCILALLNAFMVYILKHNFLICIHVYLYIFDVDYLYFETKLYIISSSEIYEIL